MDYSNGGYGICGEDRSIEKAIFVQRGADNIRGLSQTNAEDGSTFSGNRIFLVCVEWTFVKDKKW